MFVKSWATSQRGVYILSKELRAAIKAVQAKLPEYSWVENDKWYDRLCALLGTDRLGREHLHTLRLLGGVHSHAIHQILLLRQKEPS